MMSNIEVSHEWETGVFLVITCRFDMYIQMYVCTSGYTYYKEYTSFPFMEYFDVACHRRLY